MPTSLIIPPDCHEFSHFLVLLGPPQNLIFHCVDSLKTIQLLCLIFVQEFFVPTFVIVDSHRRFKLIHDLSRLLLSLLPTIFIQRNVIKIIQIPSVHLFLAFIILFKLLSVLSFLFFLPVFIIKIIIIIIFLHLLFLMPVPPNIINRNLLQQIVLILILVPFLLVRVTRINLIVIHLSSILFEPLLGMLQFSVHCAASLEKFTLPEL